MNNSTPVVACGGKITDDVPPIAETVVTEPRVLPHVTVPSCGLNVPFTMILFSVYSISASVALVTAVVLKVRVTLLIMWSKPNVTSGFSRVAAAVAYRKSCLVYLPSPSAMLKDTSSGAARSSPV